MHENGTLRPRLQDALLVLYSVVALARSQLQGKVFPRLLKANTSSEKLGSKFKLWPTEHFAPRSLRGQC